MIKFLLRSPKRVRVETAGQWRALSQTHKWGRGKPLTEVADRWTTSELPEVDALLASHAATREFSPEEGWLNLPEIDLVVVGAAAGGRTLLGVLPLADQPLGETVDEALAQPLPRHGARRPQEAMSADVFHVPAVVVGECSLRLLEASAATLREARAHGCVQAVLVAHELRSPVTPREIEKAQLQDLDRFVRKLSFQTANALVPGLLSGPFGKSPSLFIGRALYQR